MYITDQPCECEKCAGIRRHDVGLRSDNWIMTSDCPASRHGSNSLESACPCVPVITQQLGAPGYPLLPPSRVRSQGGKEPQCNVSVTRKCNSDLALVRSRVSSDLRHVTSRLRGSAGLLAGQLGQNCHGKIKGITIM